MESTTIEEDDTKSKKTTSTTELISAGTVVIIFITIGLAFLCCVAVSVYCFYKRKREKQIEQIAEGATPNVPAASPAAPGQVAVVQPTIIRI